MPRRKREHTRKYRKIRRRTYKQIGGLTPEQKEALKAQGFTPIKIAQIQELELDYNKLVRKVNMILARIQEKEAEERALLIRIQREGRASRLVGQIAGAIEIIRGPVNLRTLPERIETLRNIIEPLNEAEADVIASITRLRVTAARMNAENAENARNAAGREEANRQAARQLVQNEANRARRNQVEANRQVAEGLQAEEDALADVPAVAPAAPPAAPPAPEPVAQRARAAIGQAPVLRPANRNAVAAWAAVARAPQQQVHRPGVLQAWEINQLRDIHLQPGLEYLKRKVPQQHIHNCWADSTIVVLLQSTTMNRAIWRLLDAVLNDIITNDAGAINERLFRLEGGRPVVVDRISRLLLGLYPRTGGWGGADPLVAQLDLLNKFTFNIIRYIQKLFQIYELNIGIITPMNVKRQLLICPIGEYNPLPGGTPAVANNVTGGVPIASRHVVAAQTTQYAIHPQPSGFFVDLAIGLEYLKRVMPTMGYTELQNIRNRRNGRPSIPFNPDIIPDRTVFFGYYISVSWFEPGPDRVPRAGGVGHAMALFRVDDTWYFYDNSNFERVAPFTPLQSRALSRHEITNLQIFGANHAEYEASGHLSGQRVIIHLDPAADPIEINFGYYELSDTATREPRTLDGRLNHVGSYLFYNTPPPP